VPPVNDSQEAQALGKVQTIFTALVDLYLFVSGNTFLGTYNATVIVTPGFGIDFPLGEKEVLFSRSASNFNKLAQLSGQ
jgi:hypothetical protein